MIAHVQRLMPVLANLAVAVKTVEFKTRWLLRGWASILQLHLSPCKANLWKFN